MSFLAQVSYTGNGSTTQYSITFPYIDVTHVKAYLDGVLTTAFTVSSSTLTLQLHLLMELSLELKDKHLMIID